MISSFVTAFQSTLPIQGETNQRSIPHPCGGISIHSPYTGRDCIPYDSKIVSNISIHSPYTGRDERKGDPADPGNISIHSPYTGRDAWGGSVPVPTQHFNPLSLYRERQASEGGQQHKGDISIHSPYTGRDSNFAHKTPNIQPILLCKTPNKRTFSNTYTTNYNFPSPHIINIQVRISLHFHVHFTFALNHSRI